MSFSYTLVVPVPPSRQGLIKPSIHAISPVHCVQLYHIISHFKCKGSTKDQGHEDHILSEESADIN